MQRDTIYHGDAKQLAQRFSSANRADDARADADSSEISQVAAIITSPPYFGHRVYQENDLRELGREKSVDEYVENLVDCLQAVRLLLATNGVLWLNLGDTYRRGVLQGVPWRVAIALQDAGWLLRSDVIWHKPNAMPSAATRRPTVDHEYLFLFSNGKEYHYDADAIREPHVTFTEQSRMRGGRTHFGVRNGTPEAGKYGGKINMHDGRWDQAFHPKGRNRRTVWSVPLGKCREAHFAVFPPRLIEPCLLATVPEGEVVLDPFMGAGTTACVAVEHQRHFIGFELAAEYIELAHQRIAATREQRQRAKQDSARG